MAAPITPFVMVFGGCMLAIIAMEYVLKDNPKAGNFLSLTEFVFVLVQSIPGRLQPGTLQPRKLLAPWMAHLQHAVLWVTMSVLVNVVFAFNVRVPIHTLFRSCNVIASVVLGWAIFGHTYSLRQLFCVCVVTVGIFLASIGDAKKLSFQGNCVDCGQVSGSSSDSTEFGIWCIGISLLCFVQIIQACLGHVQAVFYKRYEHKGPRDELADEFLFTSHVVSLLPMVFLSTDITEAYKVALTTPPFSPYLPVPRSFVFMVINNFMQLACIKGVFRMSAHYSPLTLTITLSVRKFLSVVVSILWFGNPWTSLHSIATVLIFGGVFVNSQCKAPAPAPAKKLD